MNIHDYKLMDCLDKGIKDVIWIDYDEILVRKLINKGYFRKKVNDAWDRPSYFFFRYNKHKEIFMKEYYNHIKNKEIWNIDEGIGKLLGFPPKSTELFREKADNNKVNIIVNFCGMYFASYPESIKQDFDWLIQTKPLINGEIILVGSYKFIIGEDNWLDSLYKIVSVLSKTQ